MSLEQLESSYLEQDSKDRKLRAELAIVHSEMRRIWLLIVESKWGLKEGGVVLYRGKRYKVSVIEDKRTWGDDGKPWLQGNPVKKDGSWSESRRTIFDDWEPEPPSP